MKGNVRGGRFVGTIFRNDIATIWTRREIHIYKSNITSSFADRASIFLHESVSGLESIGTQSDMATFFGLVPTTTACVCGLFRSVPRCEFFDYSLTKAIYNREQKKVLIGIQFGAFEGPFPDYVQQV